MKCISDKDLIQILIRLNNYRNDRICFSCYKSLQYPLTTLEDRNFKETVLCPGCYERIQQEGNS